MANSVKQSHVDGDSVKQLSSRQTVQCNSDALKADSAVQCDTAVLKADSVL